MSKHLQRDVLQRMILLMEAGHGNRSLQKSSAPTFFQRTGLVTTEDLEIYFRELRALLTGKPLHGLVEFWPIDEIDDIAPGYLQFEPGTQCRYIGFADYQYRLLQFVFVFDHGVFKGVGSICEQFVMHSETLRAFLSLLVTEGDLDQFFT